jgi:hypothetical protein
MQETIMPESKPRIVGSVRVGGQVYTEGMEEGLVKALQKAGATEESVRRLFEKGVIAGVGPLADEPEKGEPPVRTTGGGKNDEGEQSGGPKDKDK